MTTWNSNTGNGYYIIAEVTVKSQDVANNRSLIAWKLSIKNPSNHWFNANSTGKLVVGGVTVLSIAKTIHSGGNNQTVELGSGERYYNHASNGTLSLAVAADFKTNTQGQSWSVPQLTISGKTFNPPNIPRAPLKPGAITVSQNKDTGVFTITSGTANQGGSPITKYVIERRSKDASGTYGGWAAADANASRQITFKAGRPDTDYQFRSYAVNKHGNSPRSDAKTQRSVPYGPFVRDGGTWKRTISYVKNAGVWKKVVPYAKVSGSWKNGGGQ